MNPLRSHPSPAPASGSGSGAFFGPTRLRKRGPSFFLAWAVALSLSLVWATALPAAPPPPRPPQIPLPAGAQIVGPAELRSLLENGTLTQIVDVRTPDEATSTGHLPGARFVDFFASNFIDSVKLLEFDPARPCLIYCALGGRSRRAAVQLAAHGFTHLIILEDGFEEWRRTGGRVEGGTRPVAP